MALSIEQQTRNLVSKRDALKSHLTQYKGYVESLEEEVDYPQLLTKTEKMDEYYDIFDDIQGQIEYLDQEDDQMEERIKFENCYYKYISKARDILRHRGKQETRNLVSKRGTLKSQLTRYKGYVESLEEEVDYPQLLTRTEKMDEYFNTFDDIQSQLEDLDQEDVQIEERIKFEDCYYKYISKARDILRRHEIMQTNRINTASMPQRNNNVNRSSPANTLDYNSQNVAARSSNKDIFDSDIELPTFSMPKFSGSFEDWPSFSSTFKSTIHNNSKLRDSQKLTYLHSCLSGKAAEKLKSVEITEENYAVAWEILGKTFDNSSAFIDNRIKGLVELPLCQSKHHTSLHEEGNSSLPNDQPNAASMKAIMPSQTILSTAIDHIFDNEGQPQSCRVLLDVASQSHFITERMADKLKLKRTAMNVPVTGIKLTSSYFEHSVQTGIKSRFNNATFLVRKAISDFLQSQKIEKHQLKIPRNIRSADLDFHTSAEIDAVLGVEFLYRLLCVGQITFPIHLATFQKARFGWVVGGRIGNRQTINRSICNFATNSLHDQKGTYWKLEEGTCKPFLPKEEHACETHYQKHSKRDAVTGRYTVKLSFKERTQNLGASYTTLLRRFYSRKRSFIKHSNSKSQHVDIFKEYRTRRKRVKHSNSKSQHVGIFKEYRTRRKIVQHSKSKSQYVDIVKEYCTRRKGVKHSKSKSQYVDMFKEYRTRSKRVRTHDRGKNSTSAMVSQNNTRQSSRAQFERFNSLRTD